MTAIGNGGYGGGTWAPEYNGFTILQFDDTFTPRGSGLEGFQLYANPTIVDKDYKIGSFAMGTIYTMAQSPYLSLTMSREYGGTKEFTTYNGSSISNTMWSKPPRWGSLGAWELDTGKPELSRSGRRTWDLKFSYMADGDLWGSNQSVGQRGGQYEEGVVPLYTGHGESLPGTNEGYDTADLYVGFPGQGGTFVYTAFNYNLLTDENFFSQVWHKTLGGTLPFVFQPDVNNKNPDQFAICQFKDNSLKVTQSAFNVYDVSLSIEEVW